MRVRADAASQLQSVRLRHVEVEDGELEGIPGLGPRPQQVEGLGAARGGGKTTRGGCRSGRGGTGQGDRVPRATANAPHADRSPDPNAARHTQTSAAQTMREPWSQPAKKLSVEGPPKPEAACTR